MKIIFPTLLAAVLLSGCATQYGSNYLPRAENGLNDPYGAIVNIELDNDRDVQGELLAISKDSLFIATLSGFDAISRASITEVRGNYFYRGSIVTGYSAATILGMLSSITVGWFLVFVFPAYLIGGIVSTSAAANVSCFTYDTDGNYSDLEWHSLHVWARFPAGLPEKLNRHRIRHRPKIVNSDE
jgi:hypothetical protein